MDQKELNEQDYKNKYINRGNKGRTRYPFRPRIGNTLSPSASRPGGPKCHARKNTSMINRDIEQHKIVDNKLFNSKQMRKSTIQSAVPHKGHVKINKQIKNKRKKVIEYNPMYVKLSKIRENLYLGNVDVAFNTNLLDDLGIYTIVNLCHDDIFHSTSKRKFHNIKMKDCRTMSYKELMKIYNTVESIIGFCDIVNSDHTIYNRPVLIICSKGVNRSVAMAIAYGIMHTGLKYTEALGHIEDKKGEKYDYWMCLNNIKFRHLLQCLDSKYNKN